MFQEVLRRFLRVSKEEQVFSAQRAERTADDDPVYLSVLFHLVPVQTVKIRLLFDRKSIEL